MQDDNELVLSSIILCDMACTIMFWILMVWILYPLTTSTCYNDSNVPLLLLDVFMLYPAVHRKFIVKGSKKLHNYTDPWVGF